jgi:hypothetical protein
MKSYIIVGGKDRGRSAFHLDDDLILCPLRNVSIGCKTVYLMGQAQISPLRRQDEYF